MKNPIFLMIVALALLATAFSSPAAAQPGTLIQNVNLPVPGTGVSVGTDCNGTIFYTNDSDNNLHKTDKTGANLGAVPVVDSVTGAAVFIDEIAWDGSRSLFWGVEHDTSPEEVWQIDPDTGVATHQFTSATASVGTFRDGIGYDDSDDTLWISGDISNTIEHYKTDGTFLGSITPKDAAGGTLGSISGVVVGLGDLLYLGQNGLSQIVQVKKSNGDFISSFASPGGVRDEGLECDPVSFFPTLALWSRDFGGSFVAGIEVESGTCVCVVSVKIDLKPGSNPNCVNPNSHGNVAVAIYGSATFDVSLIDTSTVRFGGAPAKRCTVSDVEMEGPNPGEFMPPDGIPDLVCHFDTQDVPWPSPGSNCGTLQITGMLSDGRPISGSDTACLPGEAACEAGTPLPLP